MKRTKRNPRERIALGNPPPAPSLSYAKVETVLTEVFDATDVQRTAFRARLKHFRKLGLPSQHPGKGARVHYAKSDLFQLMIALQLSEFSLDPVDIVRLVEKRWGTISDAIQRAQSGRDILATMQMNVMSAALEERQMVQSATELSLRSEPPAVVLDFVWADKAKPIEVLRDHGVRLGLFNLSALLRAVSEALIRYEHS